MTPDASQFESVVLVGDIGGTNATFALAGLRDNRYEIIDKIRLGSQDLPGEMEGIRRAQHHFSPALWSRIEASCFSGAGPVSNNRCNLTNVPWSIDGNVVGSQLGIPTRVINDFTGICYGIPILFRQAPDSFEPIPHGTGDLPTADGGVIAVVGAGTGLGVGFLTASGNEVTAFPSEGGHSGFAPMDELTTNLRGFVSSRYNDAPPGAECFLSGQGLVNILDFLVLQRPDGPTQPVSQILALPPAERPAAISANSSTDPICRGTMELFVQIYGAFASSVVLQLLATGGLFIAGGIAAKNAGWFLDQGRFMKAFENNYLPSIETLLKRIPVHIVKDYSVSLYGAAFAARQASMAGHPTGVQ